MQLSASITAAVFRVSIHPAHTRKPMSQIELQPWKSEGKEVVVGFQEGMEIEEI
jgi:hypothetical protein